MLVRAPHYRSLARILLGTSVESRSWRVVTRDSRSVIPNGAKRSKESAIPREEQIPNAYGAPDGNPLNEGPQQAPPPPANIHDGHKSQAQVHSRFIILGCRNRIHHGEHGAHGVLWVVITTTRCLADLSICHDPQRKQIRRRPKPPRGGDFSVVATLKKSP
jgi:hypothetical protein